jgi:hypothetical protein
MRWRAKEARARRQSGVPVTLRENALRRNFLMVFFVLVGIGAIGNLSSHDGSFETGCGP